MINKITVKAEFKKAVNYKSFSCELAIQMSVVAGDSIVAVTEQAYEELYDACVRNVDKSIKKYFAAEAAEKEIA